MSKLILQRILLVAGVIALLGILMDIAISISATVPGTTAARIEHVIAGSYQLTVNLYKDPANAGYALPFSIAPAHTVNGQLTFHVFSLPGRGIDATPIRAIFSADPGVPNGIKGAAEITVKGLWALQIQVDGPNGPGIVSVPITAVTLPALPIWLGWLIGFFPFYVLCIFFLMQAFRPRKPEPIMTEQEHVPEIFSNDLITTTE